MPPFHGSRLRALRKDKNLSMAELAKRSGVSTGLISQIERDLVIPSVVSVWRLAQVLDANINDFFDAERPEHQVIIRKQDHHVQILHGDSTTYKMLTPNAPDRLLDVVEITLKSGYSYEQPPLTHDGEECGVVLKGRLTVCLDDKEYILEEGDSIYYKSTVPHKFVNNADTDCVSLWAMTPAFF
ncbi:MAG: XRE family transcriptional regulator [Peptococcaceae bacterium]|nr:XRE family transcriptional regulator [Peptococcaceae bacterium]